MAERFAAPAVQKGGEVDLALIDPDDHLLADLELATVHTPKQHDVHTSSRRRSVPGIGKSLSLVLLDESPDIRRCPRGQACVSCCRLVTCAKESAGKRSGTSRPKMGHASLQWAFSDAAGLILRDNPAGQQYRASVAKPHGTGKALAIPAHTSARAVYYLRTRERAFAMHNFLDGSWRGAGEPSASRDDSGISLDRALCHE